MGKLNNDHEIHHFSHPHPLHLSSPSHQSPPCSACKLPLTTATTSGTTTATTSGYIYTCTTCNNFSLHVSCTEYPQLITHPSHPNHPLSLLPTSAYPEGHFKCDACKSRGNGFCYHCSQCNFDLHIICASKPLSVTNSLHPHPLGLTFSSPYEKKGFSCDICRKIGTQEWFYRCVPCEFDIHLECVNSLPAAAAPLQLQHQLSLPTVSQNQNHVSYGNQNHLTHNVSTGSGFQNNISPPGAAAAAATGPIYNGGVNNSGNGLASIGGPLQNSYPPAAGAGPIYIDRNATGTDLGNTVINAAVVEAPPLLHHHHHLSDDVPQNGNLILHRNQNHLMHSTSAGGRLQNNYPPAAAAGVWQTYNGGNANTGDALANTVMTPVAAPPPQHNHHHHHSLPPALQYQNQNLYGNQSHLMHSASTGGRLQNNYPPVAAARMAPPPPLQHHHSLPTQSQNWNQNLYGNQNHLIHSASTDGRLQNYNPPAVGVGTRYIGGNGIAGNHLANTSGMVEGAVQLIGQKFVQGAVQQIGESVMQSLIGVGDGGGDAIVDVLGGVLEGVLDTFC